MPYYSRGLNTKQLEVTLMDKQTGPKGFLVVLPRCPYEVLRTDKYDRVVCDDMFKLLVWDCYAWCAWQFFQVKDRKGNYRYIPGNWNQYAGYFPLRRLCEYVIHVV